MTALDITDASTFPSRRTEAWKYSDLRRVLKEAPEPSPSGVLTGPGAFFDLGGDAIVFVNGVAVGVDAFVASGEQTLRLRFISDATDPAQVGTGHATAVQVAARAGSKLLLLVFHLFVRIQRPCLILIF